MRYRVLGLLFAAVAGCTLTTSLDGLSGGAEETVPVEAGTPETSTPPTDAAPVEASVDAGPEAGPDLYPNGGFESGSACSGQGYNSNLAPTDQNPHGGKYSCKLCGRGTNAPTFAFDQDIPSEPVVVGAKYRATAFVRKSSADPGPTDVVSITARTFTKPGFSPVESNKTDIVLGGDWKAISVDFVPTKPADAFDVFVSANYESGTCFVVDDIAFVRLQ